MKKELERDVNGLLIVDELAAMQSCASGDLFYARIGGQWYIVTAPRSMGEGATQLRDLARPPSPAEDRITYNHEYLARGCAPRRGFRVNIGRAAAPAELADVIREYNLTDADISKAHEIDKGGVYGVAARVSYTAIQVRVAPNQAIPLESKLQEMGIEASNGSPGRVDIRVES